jgi:hypothetical protein
MTMILIRAILVAFVGLSVAMLPVAGAMARAVPSGTTLVASQSDCCPQGKLCEKQMSHNCGAMAGCMLKCSSFSASTVAPSGLTLVPSPLQQSILLAEIVRSPSVNPPLPPPRV